MTCDYQAIRRDNERRYGTDIGRIGPMLLADRYDDRTHFIYELLQNAEDALAKRGSWSGKRLIRFRLGQRELRVSHFGEPFNEADVRGVCGIAESTKDLTAIGRFGIGFKSVYAFTDRPEVYSGEEAFAVESFVWPVGSEGTSRETDETVVVLPMREPKDRGEIEAGLRRLGPGSLLFLRAIEEIEWSVEGASSGLYLRSQPERLGDSVRRIMVLGQTAGSADVEESWLIFSKPVGTPEGDDVGHVEVAFLLGHDAKSERETVRPVARSPLVVFFPTALETHLGFLVQGPYRTTPSRDNVPALDRWNRYCVGETASLCREALRWLRDNGLLTAAALRCMPLEPTKFAEGSMFVPVFEGIKQAFAEEPLLPAHGGGHVAARYGRLARTQELRDLFTPAQVTALLAAKDQVSWISGDISQDRTPELREYLVEQLQIEEIRPETLLPKLSTAFLETQPDEWVRRLYEFLGDQKALLSRARELPLVRLGDGRHVRAQLNRQPQAFLPGAVATGFPTVRPAVCDTEASRNFLMALGLTEPDLVDDVIVNVLPRYSTVDFALDAASYAADIERMLRAYRTDSESRRDRLVAALRQARFVACREQRDNAQLMAQPGEVYLATERLSQLFAGVEGVLLVDDDEDGLKSEDARELLEACGALRYLRPIEDTSLSWEDKRELRERAGHAETSYQKDRVVDWSLQGLANVLSALPGFAADRRRVRARLLWEELASLEERRGKGVFGAVYTWTHYGSYKTVCDAAFVRLLNEMAWIPDAEGTLHLPSAVLFDSLVWKPNPFLLSKIRFKPPVIDQLAREAGIEPGVLDLLKKLGVTSEAQLRQRLGVLEDDFDDSADKTGTVEGALKNLLGGDAPDPTPPVPDPSANDPVGAGVGGSGSGGAGAGPGHNVKGPSSGGASAGSPKSGVGTQDRTRNHGGDGTEPGGGGKRTPGSSGRGPFISYVATHPDDEGPDPDRIDQDARIALEAKAIELIRTREPKWQRTSAHNPGFDLFEGGADGKPIRWCEVKAMTGGLDDRPVGLSRTQFDLAREHGSAYWLYVVERAGTDKARIVRIRDPAGKACTFTFDRGWRDVAEVDGAESSREGADQ